MRVLMITGDKKFGPGHERYELQKSAVEELAVVYWGRGSYWPKLPAGTYEVVTTQDPFWRGLFGMWAAKKKRAKLNVQVHTDLSAYSGVKHVLMQIVLRHAGSVRVVSEKIKQQILKIAPRAKVTVLPVYIDVSKFTSVARREHEGKNILWIGRLEDEKDPEEALRIFKLVQEFIPEASLTILGEGSRGAYLKSAYNLKNLKFEGWQDPLHYFEIADVVLSTSRHESFGASIVEALAAGVPVVAPDVGVARDAGATIWPPDMLYKGVLEALAKGEKGRLQLSLLDKEAWAKAWAASLS